MTFHLNKMKQDLSFKRFASLRQDELGIFGPDQMQTSENFETLTGPDRT